MDMNRDWRNWNNADTQALNDEMNRTVSQAIFCRDGMGLGQRQLFGYKRCFEDGGEVAEMARLRIKNPGIVYFARAVSWFEAVQIDGESM